VARQEAQRLLAVLSGTHQLIGQLLYATGMRLLECLRLRVKDLDFRGSNGRFEVESVSVGLEGQMTHP